MSQTSQNKKRERWFRVKEIPTLVFAGIFLTVMGYGFHGVHTINKKERAEHARRQVAAYATQTTEYCRMRAYIGENEEAQKMLKQWMLQHHTEGRAIKSLIAHRLIDPSIQEELVDMLQDSRNHLLGLAPRYE